MPFTLSASARSQAAPPADKPTLMLYPSKIESGEAVRFHIVSESPVEYWKVFGESPEGGLKCFQFLEQPTPDDIASELGDYKQSLNYEKTGPAPAKFCVSFAIYEWATKSIRVCELSQKSLIRELDQISQEKDYANFSKWDFKLGRQGKGKDTEYSLRPVPCVDDKPACKALAEEVNKGFDMGLMATTGWPFPAKED